MLSVTDPADQRFDRRAVYEFCEALSAQTGMSVTVLSHPEDEPSHSLNVDALLDIDGEVWAMDHVRLVYDRQLIPAIDDIEDSLRTALEKLAEEHDGYLIVSYLPPDLSPAARQPTTVEEWAKPLSAGTR